MPRFYFEKWICSKTIKNYFKRKCYVILLQNYNGPLVNYDKTHNLNKMFDSFILECVEYRPNVIKFTASVYD